MIVADTNLVAYDLLWKETVDDRAGSQAMTRAESVVRNVPVDPDPRKVLELSVASGASGYDCVFITAAQMNGLAMATYDKPLLRRFPRIAVRVNELADRRPRQDSGEENNL